MKIPFPIIDIMIHTTSGLSENMYSARRMCSSGAPLLLVPNSEDHLNKIAAKSEILLRGTNDYNINNHEKICF